MCSWLLTFVIQHHVAYQLAQLMLGPVSSLILIEFKNQVGIYEKLIGCVFVPRFLTI